MLDCSDVFFKQRVFNSSSAQQSVHPTSGILRGLQAFFWLRVFSTSQAFFSPAHLRVTQTVSPHVFLLGVKTARLIK